MVFTLKQFRIYDKPISDQNKKYNISVIFCPGSIKYLPNISKIHIQKSWLYRLDPM